MIIDTHCHIDFHENPLEFASKYESLGYTILGVTNLPSHFEQGFPHLSNFKKVRLSLGLHPLLTEKHTNAELSKFEILSSKTSYIGEVGLDFSPEGFHTKEKQLATFQFVMKVIAKSNKLVTLHSRRAEKEVFEYLIKYNIKNAIFHWYSGPLKLIDEIASAGFFFSINPAMTASSNGRKIVERIPTHKILTETDAPFAQIDGQTVRPEDIKKVFSFLSNTRSISQDEIEEIISSNFFKLMRAMTNK